MIFIAINPKNCADVQVFDSVDRLQYWMQDQGYGVSASREIKVSDRVRFVYTHEDGRELYVYCRLMNPVVNCYSA